MKIKVKKFSASKYQGFNESYLDKFKKGSKYPVLVIKGNSLTTKGNEEIISEFIQVDIIDQLARSEKFRSLDKNDEIKIEVTSDESVNFMVTCGDYSVEINTFDGECILRQNKKVLGSEGFDPSSDPEEIVNNLLDNL